MLTIERIVMKSTVKDIVTSIDKIEATLRKIFEFQFTSKGYKFITKTKFFGKKKVAPVTRETTVLKINNK